MQSKLPLLPSGPGGVRKPTVHGPWQGESASTPLPLQGQKGQAKRGRAPLMAEPAELLLVGNVKQAEDAHADREQIQADQGPDGPKAKGHEHRGHGPGVKAHARGKPRGRAPELAQRENADYDQGGHEVAQRDFEYGWEDHQRIDSPPWGPHTP